MKTQNQQKGNSRLLNQSNGKMFNIKGLLLMLTLFTSIGGAWGQTSTTPSQTVSIGNEPYLVTLTPGSTYNWTITPGTSGIQWRINGTGNSITVDWIIAGVYTLTVTERNTQNCDGQPVSVVVTVNPLPVPTITPSENPVCFGTSGVVYTTEAGMTNYVWVVTGGLVTGGGTSTANTVTVTWNGTGPYSVRVNYTNSYGYSATTPTTQVVTVTPLPATSPIYHN